MEWKMKQLKLTKQQAREMMIKYHMINTDDHLKGTEGISYIFNRLHAIQYDPLNVVGTNSELVLQSRMIDFKKEMLEEALYQNRSLIDGWDKQMCIYQTKDYPAMNRIRKYRGELEIDTLKYRLQLDALSYIDQVLDIIKEKGPIFARDINLGEAIEHKWGHTKPSSATLDYLFQIGKIGIANKKNTMKAYDLIERLISHYDQEDDFSDDASFIEYYLLRRIQSMGLVSNKSGVHFSSSHIDKKDIRTKYLKILVDKNLVTEIEIDSMKDKYYIVNEALNLENKILDQISFLAPLDNMIWDRALIKDLFDFDYTWEVYTPKIKHKYGYYVLPILYGSNFIGRIEFEKQRKDEVLIVKTIWLEDDFKVTKKYQLALDKAIKKFADYLGASSFLYQKNEKVGAL